MNFNQSPIWTLISTFGLMSLFAVGGANAAIPEMHRIAVDVQHWMTDKQFADVYAISQLSPGPNVLIVTLIGYAVAGVAGALAATLAMCVPTAVLAYWVSRLLTRSSHSRWPAIIQAALVPLSIGLMGASGLVLALTSDRTWAAACCHRRRRGAGLCNAAQSALAVAGRRPLGFCRRDRVRRPAAGVIPSAPSRPCRFGPDAHFSGYNGPVPPNRRCRMAGPAARTCLLGIRRRLEFAFAKGS